MKQMELLQQVLIKYGFHHPIPPEIQKMIPSLKKDTLAVILKGEKEYNILVSLALSLYFKVKYLGMSLSMARSVLLVGVSTMTAACIIVAGAALGVVQLFNAPAADRGLAICALNEVSIKKPDGKIRRLEPGGVIRRGDTVLTGYDGQVMLQFGKDMIIHAGPDTSMMMTHIANEGRNDFFLGNGRMMARIERFRRGHRYVVTTPNAVAEAAGTIFLVNYQWNATTVSVGRGEVRVRVKSGGPWKTVGPGRCAVVTDSLASKLVSAVDDVRMDKVSLIREIEYLSESDTEGITRARRSAEEVIKKVDGKLRKMTQPTLREIKEQYGRIEVITLYNGKEFRGIVLSRQGKMYRMLTPMGEVYISTDEVRDRSRAE